MRCRPGRCHRTVGQAPKPMMKGKSSLPGSIVSFSMACVVVCRTAHTGRSALWLAEIQQERMPLLRPTAYEAKLGHRTHRERMMEVSGSASAAGAGNEVGRRRRQVLQAAAMVRVISSDTGFPPTPKLLGPSSTIRLQTLLPLSAWLPACSSQKILATRAWTSVLSLNE